jgi:hypothetical protein
MTSHAFADRKRISDNQPCAEGRCQVRGMEADATSRAVRAEIQLDRANGDRN